MGKKLGRLLGIDDSEGSTLGSFDGEIELLGIDDGIAETLQLHGQEDAAVVPSVPKNVQKSP